MKFSVISIALLAHNNALFAQANNTNQNRKPSRALKVKKSPKSPSTLKSAPKAPKAPKVPKVPKVPKAPKAPKASWSKSSKSAKFSDLSKLGKIHLDFNTAFLSFEEFQGTSTNLVITSFYTIQANPSPEVLAIDQVGSIAFDANKSFDQDEVGDVFTITNEEAVWPNEAITAPDSLFDFEALVVAHGFHPTFEPGKLTAINVDTLDEYIIHQSTNESPEYYHNSVFYDMDGDGLLDIISVRSGFKLFPSFRPPSGDLVWFKNPGTDLDKDVGWEEFVILSGPMAPDIKVLMYDFDHDGVPEIVTTHFFVGKKITIYGALNPSDAIWGQSGIKSVDISTDQGSPFGVEVVDLDGDGKVDILATNHEGDNCGDNIIPGRVYALEAPADLSLLFDATQWSTRILLDDIYPQPTLLSAGSPRLAPGKAKTFYPSRQEEIDGGRPWVVVGGDEAGKVWIFRPKSEVGWDYDIEVVFDINDTYGPRTTQTFMAEKPGITISTIGAVAIRYDRKGNDGMAEIFIPAFEAQDIHVYTFRKSGNSALNFTDTGLLECPVASP